MTCWVTLASMTAWDPFRDGNTWDTGLRVTRKSVENAIARGHLLSPQEATAFYHHSITSGSSLEYFLSAKGVSYRQFHVRRIAYLVVHGWLNPVKIEVWDDMADPGWELDDGNHRHAAAIMRGDETILADIRGDLRKARMLLDIRSVSEVVRGRTSQVSSSATLPR